MPKKRLSLSQVKHLERAAWASSSGEGDPDYFYDGIVFWHLEAEGRRHAALGDELPSEGWWHKEDCPCPLCKSSDTLA